MDGKCAKDLLMGKIFSKMCAFTNSLVGGGRYGPKMDGRSKGGGIHLDLDLEGVPTP